jgi:transcriptional regulator with XRE-family HTH domain
MNFSEMHERLRQVLHRRIQSSTLTVSSLSRETGFANSHISNFLRNKRRLSIDAVDRILAAMQMSVADLLIDCRPPSSRFAFDENTSSIPIVSHASAISEPVIHPSAESSELHVPLRLLKLENDHCLPARRAWQRFVAVAIAASEAAPMDPVIRSDALIILDRHDTSPPRQRNTRPVVFAISSGARLVLRYATRDSNTLILRPHSHFYRVSLIEIESAPAQAKLIVGRAVYALNPL